jgi:hypothetical protein
MVTRPLFTLIVTTYLLLVMASPGASPQFKEAFEKALIEIEHADFYKGTGDVLVEFEKLLKLGSREDIAQSVAALWADPVRISSWSRAAALEGILGPQFDRDSILKSVRSSLSHAFNANAPQRAVMASAQFLCNYGTLEDVERVKRFAMEIKQRKPELASSLNATLIGRENMIALKKSVEAAEANKESNDQTKAFATPFESPPMITTKPSPPPKAHEARPFTPGDEPTSSTPWSVGGVLIVAMIGLLLLLLKNKK